MATLKSLVNETSNIKNELVECHTNLKNKLTQKGVECNSSDKLPALINKVDNMRDEITKAKKIIFKFGTNILRNDDGEISLSRIYSFIEEISKLQKSGT